MAVRDMVAEVSLSTLEDITITQQVSFKAFFYVSSDLEGACDHNYSVRIATLYIGDLLSVEVIAIGKSQQRVLRTAGGRIFERLVHQTSKVTVLSGKVA